MKERVDYFDTIRALACLLVLLTHAAMPAADADMAGKYYAFFSWFSSVNNALFFSLSGALLFPILLDTKTFYKRRFPKLVFPLLFWSVFALALYYVLGRETLAVSLRQLVMIPFTPAIGIYWFMYVLFGLYLFAPIISKWLEGATKKELELVLVLWAFTLCAPVIDFVVPDMYNIEGSYYYMLNSFGGFVGYMLLGYYCSKYPVEFKSKTMLLLGCVAMEVGVFGILAICQKIYGDYYILTDNLSIFTALRVYVYYTLFYNINDCLSRVQPYINQFAKYSYGIYLVHIFIMRNFVWLLFTNHRMHPAVEVPLIVVASALLSFISVKLISKIPYSKYIIGV